MRARVHLLICLVGFASALEAIAQSDPAGFSTVINLPGDPLPSTISSDTQVNVQVGGSLRNNFDAGLGESDTHIEVNVLGGQIGRDAFLRGETALNLVDGIVGIGLNTSGPVQINISGGTLQRDSTLGAGGVVNVSGGQIDGRFRSEPNSVVNLSGGRIYTYYDLLGDLNMTGGSIALGFEAQPGAVIDASGGDFEAAVELQDALARLSGVQVRSNLIMRGESDVRISGGTFGGVTFEPTAAATLVGSDFEFNGQPVAGLSGEGSQATLTVPDGGLLSGVLADGTPFAFTSQNGDSFSEVTLEAAEAPAVVPGVFSVSDEVPLGLRAGQILNVAAATRHNLVVGAGSILNVLSYGTVREGAKAIKATVNVSGGRVESGFDAMLGSRVNVTGGVVDSMDVFDGAVLSVRDGGIVEEVTLKPGGELELAGGRTWRLSIAPGAVARMTGGELFTRFANLFLGGGVLDVSGGRVVGPLVTSGGQLLLRGGEFMLDGELIDLEPTAPTLFDTPGGSILTGVLADGSPFAFADILDDWLAAGSISLVSDEPAPAPSTPIIIEDRSDLAGARAQQTILVEDRGDLLATNFTALHDSTVSLQGNGRIRSFTGVGAKLIVRTGQIAGILLVQGSHAEISGGGMTGANARHDVTLHASRIDVTGGTLGYTYLHDGSHARITGGDVSTSGRVYPIFVQSGSRIEFSGSARTGGIELNDGTTGVIAGGEVLLQLDLLAGGELELIATEFYIDGASIKGLEPGESLVWTGRQGVLTGEFVSGQPFEFDLSATPNGYPQDYFDPAGLLTLTRVLPGDLNRDGAVDAADLDDWMSQYGAVVERIGDGADANYDGRVDAADYTLWRDYLAIAAVAAAPEPASLLLLVAFVALAGLGRRSL